MQTENMKPGTTFYAVVEGGGTKFNCAIVDQQRNVLQDTRIPTTSPEETIDAVCRFFLAQREQGYAFSTLGLACFGPLDLDPNSSSYGSVTATPKPLWSHYNVVNHLTSKLGCQVAIDTDVNGAALAEYLWGASQDTQVSVYMTIGTGVGGGVIVNGRPIHGLIHPEIGHMLIAPPDNIRGVCPFHGNCVEGLASGTAMGKIWQQPAETLPADHPAWEAQAQVLATLCHNLLVCYSPQKIVFGGGVMAKPGLLDRVIQLTNTSLNQYLMMPTGLSLDDIICLPGLGERSGLFGALALAMEEG